MSEFADPPINQETETVEAIEMAKSINAMWAEFLQYLPIMFGIILVFTVIASVVTLERLLRRKDILGMG